MELKNLADENIRRIGGAQITFFLLALVAGMLLVCPNLAAQTSDWETKPRTADRNYWLLTGVAVGLTVADIELTQHCLHQGTCHEGNPLVPTTNRAKLYPLQLGLTAAQSYLAYRLKRKGSKAWWLPQLSLSASHAVGVGFGLRFVWGE